MMTVSSDIKLFASYPYSFSITATLYNQYVATYLSSRLAVVTWAAATEVELTLAHSKNAKTTESILHIQRRLHVFVTSYENQSYGSDIY